MRRETKQMVSLAALAVGTAMPVAAQDRLNQANPAIVERALPQPSRPRDEREPSITAPPPLVGNQQPRAVALTVSAIVVDGAAELPAGTFTAAILPYIGRGLSTADLSTLAQAVAGAARSAGFPFASAWIAPQDLTAGILRVRLDAGTLSAVRVIGAASPAADRLLSRALVTGRAVRRDELERAILLVGDMPGITVKESRYVRQDGFGILLVTIAEDRASAYAQVDNRGSREVGPYRATVLANVRNIAQSGDEIGLIASLTPVQPSEFAFVRGRYAAPVDDRGSMLTASGSYGRAHPGASLTALNVIGQSGDAAVAYVRPLLRSRLHSLWTGLEVRALRSDQTLLGRPLRNERLSTLTASLSGSMEAAGGVLRGEAAMVAGLPLPGVTHQDDARKSRSDGDARFVLWTYNADWTTSLTDRVGIVIATAAQLASRPLLATMEIGAGGPAFGRGYDFAERTGDKGILGSADLRIDTGKVRGLVDRVQLYGSIDGGYVDNLRGGSGGGTLLSSALGARLGRGRSSGMVELAFPLNADRFDTRNRTPRLSVRLSRAF